VLKLDRSGALNWNRKTPSPSNATISPSRIVEGKLSWLTASPMVGNLGSSGN
jgi:hypothetical protein